MRMLASALVLFGSVAVAQEAEKVDNPEYQNWAKLKPGAQAKYKTAMTFNMGGSSQMMEADRTVSLVEVTPEKAVVEETNSSKFGPSVTQKRDVPAKIDKGQVAVGSFKGKFEKKGEGDEEVAVGDKKIKTHWIEYTADIEGEGPSPMKGKATMKVHVSAEIPGGSVKMELKSDDGKWSMKSALTEWKTE